MAGTSLSVMCPVRTLSMLRARTAICLLGSAGSRFGDTVDGINPALPRIRSIP